MARAKTKNSNFIIGEETVKPGESRVINLSLPGLYTMQGSLSMAVHVVNGRRPGPKLFVSAAIHGDEINGVEIIRRLMARKGLKSLRGTLVAIPIVNVFGIIQHSRYLPDGRDLNRSFPGSESGSLASRLAKRFTQEIVSHCTHGIDLHTGARHRTNLPQIRADFSQTGSLEMAQAFGVPVVLNSPLRPGSLREAAGQEKVPLIVYEAGAALRFDPFSIKTGVNGIVNVMRHLGMLDKTTRTRSPKDPWVAESSSWVRAPASGILNTKAVPGDRVRQGQVIGRVIDPTNLFEDHVTGITSPYDGIIIGQSLIPLVNEGDALFHVALFDNVRKLAAELEQFQDSTMDEQDGQVETPGEEFLD